MRRCLGCMQEYSEEFELCPYCGYAVGQPQDSMNHLAPGTVLQGRYLLGRVLGQGGFGVTYIAWDEKLQRAVAVKEYMPYALASRQIGEKAVSCYSEDARRMFRIGLEKARRETQTLAKFNDLESVVKVFDCVEENGTVYIIMELLRGKTLKAVLAEKGSLSFAEAMRIMEPVLLTLDAMHSVGMIHRDVAPDNIFICEDGRVKLLDFGAARIANTDGEKSMSVILKHGYAPVEQYSRSGMQGAFTDVYAAAATLYKLLTGETPPDALDRNPKGTDCTSRLICRMRRPKRSGRECNRRAASASVRQRSWQNVFKNLCRLRETMVPGVLICILLKSKSAKDGGQSLLPLWLSFLRPAVLSAWCG